MVKNEEKITTIVILIAPSESKKEAWNLAKEKMTYPSIKPLDIAIHATSSDLKCKGERYNQWIQLNMKVEEWPYMKAIERYNWIQFKALDYETLETKQQGWLDEKLIICSWMYGLVKPLDQIANYKLPITTKWLQKFWKETCTKYIRQWDPDIIINLLPGSYEKMFDRKNIRAKIIQPTFYSLENGEHKKITHMVKKYRGKRLRKFIEQWSPEINSDCSINIATL